MQQGGCNENHIFPNGAYGDGFDLRAHSHVRGLVFGPQDRIEKHLGYAVAALDVRGYRPRSEDVYLMYSQPRRMLGRFTQHDDRTLFLFVFATNGRPLPTALNQQKAILREIWCCPN